MQVDLLAALCALVGSRVQAYIHEPGWLYRAEFSADLARVQTLVPGDGSISFEFECGESLRLGPTEVLGFRVSPVDERSAWVQLELDCGSVLWIGQAEEDTGL